MQPLYYIIYYIILYYVILYYIIMSHTVISFKIMWCTILYGERDFTKYNMFLDQHPCWSWNNIPINQSELRDTFSGNICFRLMIRVRCFYTLVNQLSFHTNFRNKLWVGLGLGVGIGLSLYFWTVMLIQDQQKMLIQEHVLLRKITVTAIFKLKINILYYIMLYCTILYCTICYFILQ